jgi:hypothetical protein
VHNFLGLQVLNDNCLRKFLFLASFWNNQIGHEWLARMHSNQMKLEGGHTLRGKWRRLGEVNRQGLCTDILRGWTL